MKLLKRIRNIGLVYLQQILKVINQLPDRRIKVRQSPHQRDLKFFIKGGNPVSEKITIPHHRRDRKPKGSPHSETMIFNHPRG